MIIYCATNRLNGKKYIGQTVQTLAIRMSNHMAKARNGYKGAFCNAIRKYGADAFEWTRLDTASDIEELNAREEYYIAAYETRRPKGYNIMFGGGNRRQPLAVRKKIGEGNKGKKLTEETKRRIGERAKADYASGKRAKITGEKNPSFGKKPTDETRRKISEWHKGKKHTAEHRKKLSAAQKGKKHTEEHKKKRSEAQRDKVIYDFRHDDHGLIASTQYNLRTKYGLDRGHLSALIRGKVQSHKGWRMAGGSDE